MSDRESNPDQQQDLISRLSASVLSNKPLWIGGGAAVIAGVVALVVVYGGFFGPSGTAICTPALKLARDYGVIPYDAVLSSSKAKKTDMKSRRACAATAGGVTYQILADVKFDDKACRKDLSKPDCVTLHSVARADGLLSYLAREVPPDETAATDPSAGTGAAGAPDPDIAVDNSGAGSTGPSDAVAGKGQ